MLQLAVSISQYGITGRSAMAIVPAVTKRHGSDTMKYKSTLYIFEWTELNKNNETSLLHLINTLQPNERVKHILYTVTSDNIRFFYNAVVVIEKELESEDK